MPEINQVCDTNKKKIGIPKWNHWSQ